MPKRKTADVSVEPVAASKNEKRKSASKPKTAAAATHMHTPRKAQADVVPNVVPVPVASPVTPRKPTQEQIARLAYSYWEARGFQHGSPEQDWFRAEAELLKLS